MDTAQKRFTYSRAIHKKVAEWVAALEIEIAETLEFGDPIRIEGKRKNLAAYRVMLKEYEGRLGL